MSEMQVEPDEELTALVSVPVGTLRVCDMWSTVCVCMCNCMTVCVCVCVCV